MMGGSGLIGFLQILGGWCGKATQDYESSSGACESLPDTRDTPKISPRRWPYFGLAECDYRLPLGNR